MLLLLRAGGRRFGHAGRRGHLRCHIRHSAGGHFRGGLDIGGCGRGGRLGHLGGLVGHICGGANCTVGEALECAESKRHFGE